MCEEEVHEAIGGTTFVNAIGADNIPVRTWIIWVNLGFNYYKYVHFNTQFIHH